MPCRIFLLRGSVHAAYIRSARVRCPVKLDGVDHGCGCTLGFSLVQCKGYLGAFRCCRIPGFGYAQVNCFIIIGKACCRLCAYSIAFGYCDCRAVLLCRCSIDLADLRSVFRHALCDRVYARCQASDHNIAVASDLSLFTVDGR